MFVGWLGLIGNDTAIGAYRNLFWRRWLGAFASECGQVTTTSIDRQAFIKGMT